MSLELASSHGQDRHWSRHAARYDDLFLDPFRPGVVNPLLDALDAVQNPESKSVIDLGCGTGPLLPLLTRRFGAVTALDFAPAMIDRARKRLGEAAGHVTFETRPMHQLGDFAGKFDVAVAINSLVMPDVRAIDETLRAVHAALKPGGLLLAIVPAMDAIRYHTMLLWDQALDQGREPESAERLAAVRGEHAYYDFAFGRFLFQGLRQKFWESFEIEYRLRKAGFSDVALDRVLYPWDDDQIGGAEFADQPKSWDWSFAAHP
jgi:SAM-dependent methyltransferase